HAPDLRHFTAHRNIGSKARQLLHMHEAVLEDGFANFRYALGAAHKRHKLSLEIGRKARIRLSRNIDGLETRAVPHHAQTTIRFSYSSASLAQYIKPTWQKISARAFEMHIATRRRYGHGVGAGLNTVGQHGMRCAFERAYALDIDCRRASTFDFGAHLV